MYINVLIIFIALLGFTACSSKPHFIAPAKVSSKDSPVVKKILEHYSQWKGVKYREGGMSKQGVDCSGYVYLSYKNSLNKKIPRTTELLSQSGKLINSAQIKPGDLVFFKTGFKVRHVGIYIKDNQFVHASSSRGVMISKLNNPYWLDAFWMARRF